MNESIVYRTPLRNRLGDCLALAWQLPLVVFLGTFFCMVIALAARSALFPGADETLVGIGAWSGVAATIYAALPLLRRMVWWRLRIEGDELQLGYRGLGGVAIPCGLVTLVRDVELVAMEHKREGSRAIVITARGKEHPFWVDDAESAICLEAVRDACPGAAALDRTGQEHLPANPANLPSGLVGLGSFQLASGRALIVTGLFLALFGGVLTVKAITGGAAFSVVRWGLTLAVSGVGSIAAGVAQRRRGRARLAEARRAPARIAPAPVGLSIARA